MSREIRNQRILDLAKKLPGREDPTDQSRGYVGWGPEEDYTCEPGRTVYHATWQDFLGAVQTPAREIHDFYFEHHVESEDCACCAGSGKNEKYAELERNFHGPRGWGKNLSQEEIDALAEAGRLGRNVGKGDVTPETLGRHLGPIGHDAINRWILVPVRAKRLGISTDDCFECVGTGKVPVADAVIKLHVWTFDTAAGTSRVDTVQSIAPDEIGEVRQFMEETGWEGVKRRFGWAVSDNMHPEIVYEDDWDTFGSRKPAMKGEPSFRGIDGAYQTWKHYGSGFDTDLNLVFDYKVIAPPEARDQDFAGSQLPERFGLRIWMTHPRKGTDVIVAIREATREDAEDIKEFLRRSFEVHGRHFAWAAGRAFGNEKEREEEPQTEGMALFMPGR